MSKTVKDDEVNVSDDIAYRKAVLELLKQIDWKLWELYQLAKDNKKEME